MEEWIVKGADKGFIKNNNIVDWIEDGYKKPPKYYHPRNSKTLENFLYVSRENYDLCWAVVISMAVEWFTEDLKM